MDPRFAYQLSANPKLQHANLFLICLAIFSLHMKYMILTLRLDYCIFKFQRFYLFFSLIFSESFSSINLSIFQVNLYQGKKMGWVHQFSVYFFDFFFAYPGRISTFHRPTLVQHVLNCLQVNIIFLSLDYRPRHLVYTRNINTLMQHIHRYMCVHNMYKYLAFICLIYCTHCQSFLHCDRLGR